MKRDAVYYVIPMGKSWLVRAIGYAADSYPTLEDALAAAEGLAARGARVRVLARPDVGPSIAHASTDVDDAQRAAS